MYSSRQIANYFIEKSLSSELISPMKLQKLVYFAYGWYWAYHNKPLLNEQIQAWQFGPVEPVLYHATKGFGNGNITRLITEIDDQWETYTPTLTDEQVKGFLDIVWKVYGKFSAAKLSTATHAAGTPWSKTIDDKDNKPFRKNIVIPDSLIKDHFTELLEATKKKKADHK